MPSKFKYQVTEQGNKTEIISFPLNISITSLSDFLQASFMLEAYVNLSYAGYQPSDSPLKHVCLGNPSLGMVNFLIII